MLTGIKEASFPADADDTLCLGIDSGTKAQKALHRNNLDAACLTMSFMTEDLMSKARKACAVECPAELAHLIRRSNEGTSTQRSN